MKRETMHNTPHKKFKATRACCDSFYDVTFRKSNVQTPTLCPLQENPDHHQLEPFKNACSNGDMVKVLFLLEKGNKYLLEGLCSAAEGGHDKIVELLSTMKIPNPHRGWNVLNLALQSACKGDHASTIQLLIEKGVDYWPSAVAGACEGGHLDLMKKMLQHPAFHDWSFYLQAAAVAGQLHIVKYIMDVENPINVHLVLEATCQAGRFDVAKFLLQYVNDPSRAMRQAAEGAGRHYNQKVMDFIDQMINMGASDFTACLNMACKAGNLDIIKYMLAKGAKVHDYWTLLHAGEGGHTDVIDYILELVPNVSDRYDKVLCGACWGGNLAVVHRMIEMGAHNFDDALASTIERAQVGCAKLMIEKGAKGVTSALQQSIDYFTYHRKDDFECLMRLLIKSGAKHVQNLTNSTRDDYGESSGQYEALIAAQRDQ
jgi:ankyrin repeat protein